MSDSKEIKSNQYVIGVEFDSCSKDQHPKDDKPLQDVFDIILNQINISGAIKSGDG